MRTIQNYFKLIRIQNCLIALAAVLLGAHLTEAAPAYYRPLIVSLAAFLLCAAGNSMNDILDIESDRINHPDRVLVTGALSREAAVRVTSLTTGLAVLLAVMSGWFLLLVLFAAAGLLWFYNSMGKHLPIVGNLIVALLGSVLFLVGGMAVDFRATFVLPGPIIPAAIAFGFHLLREIIKDIEDMAGDESVTSGTIAIKLGQKNSLHLAFMVHLVTVAAVLWPVVAGWYSGLYAWVASVGVLFPNSIVLMSLLRRPTQSLIATTTRVLKLTMVIGVAALLLA
ncbi:MAG: geranylgeranylglycerol-phosphate geranylgeranyltransferase [bacterium]|nr:geranylgeranylglycerol-phosphate geranylgeranyltransferase [bacterium]